ncbi:thiol reductant ABC exporter subunit CydD [Roseibium sp. CAU 1639]|uniref:Thiol reductant ABC exporter subunit CydD n=2 Tax=Roseibium sediminicola TaxID=2933272 RepID=A0ABT0H103_9HYPH|nr:thiol reductant ABC exporter subunit CydD [Roseibium sp. CAU 1639]MCK7614743.1 thiol reductant ABC exporter subunit CydD [Roseibium sp. CAU 1639]
MGVVNIGQPLAKERQCLRRAGWLAAASDLLWIPQAGLIAFALGVLLTSLHAVPEETFAIASVSGPALVCVTGLVLLAILRVVLQGLGADMARQAAQSLQSRARAQLLTAAAQASPAADFPSSGAFAAHVTEQVDHLGPYYRNFFPQVLRLKIVPLAIVLATAWFSWLAALILLVCGPLIPVFMALIGMKAKAASADQQEELTRLSGTLLDRIRGLETLELFGALDRTREDIAAAGERFRLGTMRVLRIAFLSSTVLELFSALGIAFCAVFVGFSLLGDLSIGAWGAPLGYAPGLFILLLAPEFFAPLRAYAAAYHDRAAGLAAQENLSRILKECRPGGSSPAREGDESAVTARKCPGLPAIEVKAATLLLGGQTVFKDFNLLIEPGETILLTGASSSGKTSLIDSLLGFHRLEQGEIRIGGVSPQQAGPDLLQTICWLGQAPRLFHGSLKANLLKGATRPETVTEADLWRALALAGATDLVARLPRGLATPVGEDGFGLSVGEIRRIALARAALRTDAAILLADEPTAALDEDTAADVIAGLAKLSRSRTTVIATHDPAVLSLPGRIIDLNTLEPALAGVRS